MDESSSSRDIASAMGNLLRSFSDAGYELRRVAPPSAVRTWSERFDELVTNDLLRQTSGSLFRDSYYARAVEEAFKCLNNAVKDKSGLAERDGAAKWVANADGL